MFFFQSHSFFFPPPSCHPISMVFLFFKLTKLMNKQTTWSAICVGQLLTWIMSWDVTDRPSVAVWRKLSLLLPAVSYPTPITRRGKWNNKHFKTYKFQFMIFTVAVHLWFDCHFLSMLPTLILDL